MATVNDRLDSLEESRSELSAAVKALADGQQEHTRILSQHVDILNRLVATQTDQGVLLTQIVASQTQIAATQAQQAEILASIVATLQAHSIDLSLIKVHLGIEDS